MMYSSKIFERLTDLNQKIIGQMEFDMNGIDCVFAEDILLKVFSAEDFTIKKLKAKWSGISSSFLYRNSHMSQK